ncbi:hypothetical protein [Spirosoma pollinicola]|uniref:DUF4148 domain-containing protein n=1 Tax=Spirosoma pollinicola TaxID=2057025 RepID=A0A2K8YZ18_9BACT|nr:hypothetical protein [Spirosoma pollinicola]AUD02873.1 hypothetical protein CWM47_14140 [Spirosoma pollinicola]
MKLVAFLLAGISLTALSEQAFSQDDGAKKPLNNPMYSSHNYKHPTMAAAARRQETKAGITVQQPTPGNAQLANYKNQMPTRQPVGGVTVDHMPSGSLADRNYKIQRVSEPTPIVVSEDYIVKKRRTDNQTIGN